MAEGPFTSEKLSAGELEAWSPSEKLRLWLLIGAGAVLIEVCLSGTSCWIDFSRHQQPEGFTITDGLDLLCLLPGFLILLAFLALAREAGSLGLWRSSIGLFGSTWLLGALVYSDPEVGPAGLHVVLAVAVGIGAICLFAIVASNPSGFLQPASAESPAKEPESEKSKPKNSGWGCFSVLGAAVLTRLILRGLRRMRVEWFELLCIVGALILVCCFVFFLIWFGISKIRLRRKFGIMAAVSGWADLLGVVLNSALFAYMGWVTIQAVMNEQEPDFYEPTIRIPEAAVSIYDIGCTVLIGALFLSVRNRAKPEWQEKFDATMP